MEKFTPLYAIAYAIMNSMENLRFDKEGYFHFYVLFYKRNRKHFFTVFPYVIETLVEVWENSKLRGNGLVFSLQFLVLPNFHSCSHFNFAFSQTSTRVSTSISRPPKLPLVFPLQFLVLPNFHSCSHFNFSFSQTSTRVPTSIFRSLKLPLVFL